MEILVQILVSVAAHVIGYFVCKWFDRHPPESGYLSGGFACESHGHTRSMSLAVPIIPQPPWSMQEVRRDFLYDFVVAGPPCQMISLVNDVEI